MKFFLLAGFILSSFLLRAQLQTDSLLIGGHHRSFHFNRPSPSTVRGPLVFVLHGSGGRGLDMMRSVTKMDSMVSSVGGVVVYPNGYKRYWNECRKASPAEANRIDIDEQAFFSSMIRYFSKNFRTDQSKVFVVGTSGGGHMAYKLGLTMPQTFKAVTAIIANLPDSTNFDCKPSGKPVPVMIINGTEDTVNPYNGGEVVAGFSLGFVRSTEETFRYWSNLAGHRGEPVKEMLADRDPADGRVIERYRYAAAGKPDVVLLKVIGGEHDYPKDIDVHVEAWQFFKKQLEAKR